jgi:hypothetical protein
MSEIGEDTVTPRGFGVVRFADYNGNVCSLQNSSLVETEKDPLGYIWLGIDDANPIILASDARKAGLTIPRHSAGWIPYPIPREVLLHTRMHLNERQVRWLIARLQTWMESGSIHAAEKGDQA